MEDDGDDGCDLPKVQREEVGPRRIHRKMESVWCSDLAEFRDMIAQCIDDGCMTTPATQPCYNVEEEEKKKRKEKLSSRFHLNFFFVVLFF